MDPVTADVVRTTLNLAAGAVGLELVKWLRDFITGRAQQRRADIDKLSGSIAAAELAEKEAKEGEAVAVAERDIEAAHRRLLQEHASELRRLLIADHGVASTDLPPFPTRPHSTQG